MDGADGDQQGGAVDHHLLVLVFGTLMPRRASQQPIAFVFQNEFACGARTDAAAARGGSSRS